MYCGVGYLHLKYMLDSICFSTWENNYIIIECLKKLKEKAWNRSKIKFNKTSPKEIAGNARRMYYENLNKM